MPRCARLLWCPYAAELRRSVAPTSLKRAEILSGAFAALPAAGRCLCPGTANRMGRGAGQPASRPASGGVASGAPRERAGLRGARGRRRSRRATSRRAAERGVAADGARDASWCGPRAAPRAQHPGGVPAAAPQLNLGVGSRPGAAPRQRSRSGGAPRLGPLGGGWWLGTPPRPPSPRRSSGIATGIRSRRLRSSASRLGANVRGTGGAAAHVLEMARPNGALQQTARQASGFALARAIKRSDRSGARLA